MQAFKNNILLGVSASATQIDGGNKNNSWYQWYKKGKIKDNSDPSLAINHYNLYEEDIALMKKLNIKIYRMGIEWSRIQPEMNKFDDEVIFHYRNEIIMLKENGIEPLLTLHHFTNPTWFEDMGAFTCKNAPEIFCEYVEYVINHLGDLVDEYVTINEPNIYSLNGYITTFWPPGQFSVFKYAKVLGTLAVCHIYAYELIHRLRNNPNTKVGFAHHLSFFEPKNEKNPIQSFLARFLEKTFQTNVGKAMNTGVFPFLVKKVANVPKGKYYDFIGINYYCKTVIYRFDSGARVGEPINDLGWQIYPMGIVEVAKKMYDEYKAPIYITENGTCDNTDAFRSRYLYEHLKVLNESNLPVERYYQWSLFDNFEWAEGYSSRFGIVHIDYETQKRTIKKSGEFYGELIKENEVTQEMYDKYVKDEVYPLYSKSTLHKGGK